MNQRVDQFIPVQRKQKALVGQYGQQYLKRLKTTSLDITSPQHPVIKLAPTGTESNSLPSQQTTNNVSPAIEHTKSKTMTLSKDSTRKNIRQYLKFTWLIIGIIFVGLVIQSQIIGIAVIGLYALFTYVKHVSSRNTYFLALLALVCVLISLLSVHGESIKSNNYTLYACMLLITGTISRVFEFRNGSI